MVRSIASLYRESFFIAIVTTATTHCEKDVAGLREIDRLVDGITKGVGNPNDLGAWMSVLKAERKTLNAEFEFAPPPVNVLALHPAVLGRYAEQLGKLQDALAKGINAGDSDGSA
ncbi:hypothetical protein QEV83_10485 [Methylocapsa sp. D3K7]|uniref:hypothetical protein n=1 Tax=Methylocapsa sp. D3K7 TaxID=3041435 RepID=UPI00244EB6A2|nr:hypothetical protein [Methylocapsa sp. D3K7]WGJ13152.1 hypothetical protein QEV83_10485 [Methylocapsa sp. D3K7]